jgi:hypothetical protein
LFRPWVYSKSKSQFCVHKQKKLISSMGLPRK